MTVAAGGALAGAVAVVTALGILALLPRVLDGALLSLSQVVVALTGIFAALIGFSAIFVSFAEIESNASFEISKTKIRFNDIQNPSGAEAKFIEREIELNAVRNVRMDRSLMALLLGYGNVEIFTDWGPEPAVTIPGVTRPHLFKEKFELLLTHCDTATSQLKALEFAPSRDTG